MRPRLVPTRAWSLRTAAGLSTQIRVSWTLFLKDWRFRPNAMAARTVRAGMRTVRRIKTLSAHAPMRVQTSLNAASASADCFWHLARIRRPSVPFRNVVTDSDHGPRKRRTKTFVFPLVAHPEPQEVQAGSERRARWEGLSSQARQTFSGSPPAPRTSPKVPGGNPSASI